MLHALGLDDDGWATYKAMLAGPVTHTSGLSARTGLTQDQVQFALVALAAVHLVRPIGGTPPRWEPVNPQTGLAPIVRRQEADLVRQQREITAAYAAAAAVYAGSAMGAAAANGSTPAHLERLAGATAVHAMAENLARSALLELRITVPQAPGGWQAGQVLKTATVAAGVKLRALYPCSTVAGPVSVAQAARLAGLGAQTRMTPYLPPVLMISDQQAALIPLYTSRPGSGALCVREQAIIAALTAVFDNAWDSATPLATATSPAGTSILSAAEQALLTLLADGLTHQAAGRKLGISARTVARRMSVLLVKLGASSRFQAVHIAAQQGWLANPPPIMPAPQPPRASSAPRRRAPARTSPLLHLAPSGQASHPNGGSGP